MDKERDQKYLEPLKLIPKKNTYVNKDANVCVLDNKVNIHGRKEALNYAP